MNNIDIKKAIAVKAGCDYSLIIIKETAYNKNKSKLFTSYTTVSDPFYTRSNTINIPKS